MLQTEVTLGKAPLPEVELAAFSQWERGEKVLWTATWLVSTQVAVKSDQAENTNLGRCPDFMFLPTAG